MGDKLADSPDWAPNPQADRRFLDLNTIGDGTVLDRIKRGETVHLVYDKGKWVLQPTDD